jgi:hypothetical protein
MISASGRGQQVETYRHSLVQGMVAIGTFESRLVEGGSVDFNAPGGGILVTVLDATDRTFQ